jgi:DNA topoisomerase VI subunit A
MNRDQEREPVEANQESVPVGPEHPAEDDDDSKNPTEDELFCDPTTVPVVTAAQVRIRIAFTRYLLRLKARQFTQLDVENTWLTLPVMNWVPIEESTVGRKMTGSELKQEFERHIQEQGNAVQQRVKYRTVFLAQRILRKIAKRHKKIKRKDRTKRLTITSFRYKYMTDVKYAQILRILDHLKIWMGVELYDMGFTPLPRGKFIGDFKIAHKNDSSNIFQVGTGYGSNGAVSIDPEIMAPEPEQRWDYQIEFGTKVKAILIVESFSMLEFLRCAKFHTKNQVIIVAANGKPDRATRAFVKQLLALSKKSEAYKDSDIPVFGAADCNPSGYAILHGFERTLGKPLQWVGAFLKDIEPHIETIKDVTDNAQVLTDHDTAMLNKSAWNFAGENDSRRAEVESMIRLEKKFEFEILESIKPGWAIDLLRWYMFGIDPPIEPPTKKRKQDSSSSSDSESEEESKQARLTKQSKAKKRRSEKGSGGEETE